MHKHAMEMGKWALEKAKTHGYDNLNSQDWDDLKDCMEVVKNAICADKEYREVDEMDEMEKLYGRMGYRGRDSKGRFVHRSGRGRSVGMGYTPLWHMMPGMDDMYDDDYMEMMPENYRMGYTSGRGGNRSNSGNYAGQSGNSGRYGYDDGMGYSHDGRREGSRYGRSYDNYRQAKRHYTESKNPDEQKKMKQHIDEIFDDMSDMTSEIARDMTPEEKQRYKQKLQMIMQKI